MSVREALSRIFIKSDNVSSEEDLDLKSIQNELTGKDKELARKLDLWVVTAEERHEAQLAENTNDSKGESVRNSEKINKKPRRKAEPTISKESKDFEIAD